MKVTLCFQFDGATLNSDSCDLITKDCFNEKKLKEYSNEYGADSFSYYLDQPNFDDGWVAIVAYLSLFFDDIDENSPEYESILDKINDGEKVSEIIEKLGYKNSYWFYDVE